jgi:hypothetical protein
VVGSVALVALLVLFFSLISTRNRQRGASGGASEM